MLGIFNAHQIAHFRVAFVTLFYKYISLCSFSFCDIVIQTVFWKEICLALLCFFHAFNGITSHINMSADVTMHAA
jgi:hypothetical protein